jgi:hypothetical protein
MADDQKIPWYQQGFTNWQPQNINPSPLGGYGIGFQGLGSVPQSDILSKGFDFSSESGEAMQATSAKNSAQRADAGAGSLIKAMDLIKSMRGDGGTDSGKRQNEGIPLPGSENTRLRYSASGVPYYTTNVSPTSGSDSFTNSKWYIDTKGNKVWEKPTEEQETRAAWSIKQLERDKAEGKLPAGEEERRKGMIIKELGQQGRIEEEERKKRISSFLGQ